MKMGSNPPEADKPAKTTAGKKDGGQVVVKGEGVLYNFSDVRYAEFNGIVLILNNGNDTVQLTIHLF